MLGLLEDGASRTSLDDMAGMHDRDTIRIRGHRAEIVRDL